MAIIREGSGAPGGVQTCHPQPAEADFVAGQWYACDPDIMYRWNVYIYSIVEKYTNCFTITMRLTMDKVTDTFWTRVMSVGPGNEVLHIQWKEDRVSSNLLTKDFTVTHVKGENIDTNLRSKQEDIQAELDSFFKKSKISNRDRIPEEHYGSVNYYQPDPDADPPEHEGDAVGDQTMQAIRSELSKSVLTSWNPSDP